MNVLLTGATGYIGKRLLPILAEENHTIYCLVRDKERFNPPPSLRSKIFVIEGDLLKAQSLNQLPKELEYAYYLVHSMSASDNYDDLEEKSALNFRMAIENSNIRQVIYLSGMTNEDKLSKHLQSRRKVEEVLSKGKYALTTLRAGIIIGSGSASFEIIRDLVEKLPFMVAPKWLKTKCQPIGIRDVLIILKKTLANKKTFNKNFDIAGSDILSYKEMLLVFSQMRGLKRRILIVPVLTPRLSSYWLYFVTSTSYKLARSLVESMKIEVVARNSEINEILNHNPVGYQDALKRTFEKINNNEIVSSWKDSYTSSGFDLDINDFIEAPNHGCFKDKRSRTYNSKEATVRRIWQLGGKKGWYYANWMWKLRGYLDKLVGGVGLRRGRTHPTKITAGDALDFWRVLYADEKSRKLLLYAEMKLPGEAWLEFEIKNNQLVQTATFRPLGIFGRIYWYSVLPLHGIIFRGMIKRIAV